MRDPLHDAPDGDPGVDPETVARDAEESLVAALQESDTAVEALHDVGAGVVPDAGAAARPKLWVAGAVLAVLGLVVARRRR